MGLFFFLELVVFVLLNIFDLCVIKWLLLVFFFEIILYKIVFLIINIIVYDIKLFIVLVIIFVFNVDVGIIFWICGVFGVIIVKVEYLKVKVVGINFCGKLVFLKIFKVIGNIVKFIMKIFILL